MLFVCTVYFAGDEWSPLERIAFRQAIGLTR
jgi:hypothetical protein